MHDRDPAAEPAEHLPEFEADIASPQNDQVFWKIPQFHDAGIREITDRFQAIDAGDRGPGPAVYEDPLALQRIAVHRDLVRPHEAGLSTVQIEGLAVLDIVF